MTDKNVSRKGLLAFLFRVFGIICTVIVAFPLYIMINIAVKSKSELAQSPFALPKGIEISNFTRAIEEADFFRLLGNSLFITVVTVTLLILISSTAAYSIARHDGKFYKFLYIFFLSGLMVPTQMIMLPLYRLVSKLGLMNSSAALIATYLGAGMPFLVFYMTGFLKSIPRELDEAALIDGASRYQTFWFVIFPLMKTAVLTVTVLQVIWVWNDFLIPMLFMNDYSQMPIMVGIYSFRGERGTEWNLMFALILLTILPVMLLYVFFQKYIIDGFVAGAIKG